MNRFILYAMMGALPALAAVEFDASDDDEEGEESYQELYEFVRLIPVSLGCNGSREVSEFIKIIQYQNSLCHEQMATL